MSFAERQRARVPEAVDHHRHEALVATEPDTGAIVAVARFVTDARDVSSAEVAIVVADAWQR